MSAKQRIFLESHNINNLYTGFGQFNYWLIKSLTKNNRDYEFTAYAKKKSLLKDFPEVRFQKYYSWNRYRSFSLRTRYDLWHSLNQNSKIEPYYSMPYLLTLHDVISLEKDKIEDVDPKKIKLLTEKINRSNAIVFISKHAKTSANHYFDIPKDIPQQIIYNGNPVKAQKPVTNIKTEVDLQKPFLFCIGQFLEMKNFHSLVGMLSRLKDFQLVIAGNNNKPYAEVVRQEIQKFKLEDRIFLSGRISDTEKHFYLQNCEAFVFPSLFEGFGLPPIEAMTYGKPVFLANRTSLPEIGGNYAFYWDEFDPETMASVFEEGMNTFHNNEKLYEKELKRRAADFDWDETAKKYLQTYSEILNNQ